MKLRQIILISEPQIMLDLNAYGQACTYELYGKYVSNIEY